MNLSPFLYGLSQLIGPTATMKLIANFGGTGLTVPKNMHPDHALAQLIGLEAAQKLSATHGGERLSIALYTHGHHKQISIERRRRIRELRAQGLSHAQIARELKTTDRTVRKVLGTEADDRQKNLFE